MRTSLSVLAAVTLVTGPLSAQAPAIRPRGSANIQVLAHLPLGKAFTTAGIEVEQDLSRPFAYVSRKIGGVKEPGFDIIQVNVAGGAKLIYSWRIPNGELHAGL